MRIDTDLVHSAVRKLGDSADTLISFNLLGLLGRTADFSTVPGLNEAGSYHGLVRDARGPEATRGLAWHLSNTSELLQSQLSAYSTQDIMNGVGLLTPNEGVRMFVCEALIEREFHR